MESLDADGKKLVSVGAGKRQGWGKARERGREQRKEDTAHSYAATFLTCFIFISQFTKLQHSVCSTYFRIIAGSFIAIRSCSLMQSLAQGCLFKHRVLLY